MSELKFQRDVFIEEVRAAAKRDRDIVFISADFGAPALDAFRSEQASQFLHAGISEQNMIDLAAGLALAGKKAYVYAMAPFITLRCIEQIKCSLAIMNLPVTVLAVGVGLSYADSGPTHYTTEDLACMRSLAGAEVLTAADSETARAIARLTIDKPAFRIVRLDRNALPTVYSTNAPEALARGFHVTGIDTSAKMLQAARRKVTHPSARFLHADGGALPFTDGSFDIVFSSYVLHGLQPDERKNLYREMKRVAKHLVIVHDYNQTRSITTSIVEWAERGDYFRFIQAVEEEMRAGFSDLRVIPAADKANWYVGEI